jgi:hypothetical protein
VNDREKQANLKNKETPQDGAGECVEVGFIEHGWEKRQQSNGGATIDDQQTFDILSVNLRANL